jgi:hypothetical protein
MTNKKLKKSENESSIRIEKFSLVIYKFKFHFLHIVLIGIIIFFIYEVSAKTMKRKECAEKGLITKAIIYDIQKKGSKGVKDYCYRFSFENKIYNGLEIYTRKEIGDSVYVVFLPENPENNKMLENLEKNDLDRLLRNPRYKEHQESLRKINVP